MTYFIIFLTPFALKQSLCSTISSLLAYIGRYRISAVMPHQCSGAKTDGPALGLQPPADVHIITRHAKLRIESSDCLKLRFTERHIAPGNMFGNLVCQHNMNRSSRGIRHAFCDGSIAWRLKVWTSY